MRFENTVALMGQEYVPSLAEWSEGRQRAALEDLGSYESAGRRGQRPFDESGAAGLQPSRKEGVLRRFIAGAAVIPWIALLLAVEGYSVYRSYVDPAGLSDGTFTAIEGTVSGMLASRTSEA